MPTKRPHRSTQEIGQRATGRHNHIETNAETRAYRRAILASMPAWRETQIRIAHARYMAERKGK